MMSSLGQKMIRQLNGPWHKHANILFIVLVLAHWVEHLVQAYQVYALGHAAGHSHGAIGSAMPWLNTSEWLHFGYALIILVGLAVLWPGYVGRARLWWTAALAFQGWHFIEHALLLIQVQGGFTLFGGDHPMSLAQLIIPRLELHLFYNTIVTIPLLVAMYRHLLPHHDDEPAPCTCAWVARTRQSGHFAMIGK